MTLIPAAGATEASRSLGPLASRDETWRLPNLRAFPWRASCLTAR